MKQNLIIIAFVFGVVFTTHAQMAQKIGDNPMTLNPSAIFETESVTKGLLPPRMTTIQRNAIASPPAGLVVYNTTTNLLEIYNGAMWSGGHNIPKEYVAIPSSGTINASNTQSQIFIMNNCDTCNPTIVLPTEATNGLEHIIRNRTTSTITFMKPPSVSGNKPVSFIANSNSAVEATSFILTANKTITIVFFDYDANDSFSGTWYFFD
jgi:hypothetical protein